MFLNNIMVNSCILKQKNGKKRVGLYEFWLFRITDIFLPDEIPSVALTVKMTIML